MAWRSPERCATESAYLGQSVMHWSLDWIGLNWIALGWIDLDNKLLRNPFEPKSTWTKNFYEILFSRHRLEQNTFTTCFSAEIDLDNWEGLDVWLAVKLIFDDCFLQKCIENEFQRNDDSIENNALHKDIYFFSFDFLRGRLNSSGGAALIGGGPR